MEKQIIKYKDTFRLSSKEKQELDRVIHTTTNASVYRRAMALLAMDAGEAASALATQYHVSRQVLYKWIWKFQDSKLKAIESRLMDEERTGRPKRVSGVIDPWILEVIDTDPRDYTYPATTWTARLLARYIHDRHRVSVSYNSIRRAIDRLGFSWKRPRYILSNRPSNWRHKKGALNMGFSTIPGE